MKKIIITAIAITLTSCGLPVSIGIQKDGVGASYSTKGGLEIVIIEEGK